VRCDDHIVSADSLIASFWPCPKLVASWPFYNERFVSDLVRVLGFVVAKAVAGQGVPFLRS